MRVAFEKEYLRSLYETGKTSDKKHCFQPQVVRKYAMCVKVLENADRIESLFRYNALNYEKLKGNKKGLSSVRINDQYRLEFREISNPNNVFEIEICALTDITNHYK
jgi:proteic killer suppression protein